MPDRTGRKPRTIRAVRTRRTSPVPDTSAQAGELSNYELLERRSRELEVERAHGGSGTSQPPDADTPLLFPKFCAGRAQAPRERTRERRRLSIGTRASPGRQEP
jgi:hypothetical protein